MVLFETALFWACIDHVSCCCDQHSRYRMLIVARVHLTQHHALQKQCHSVKKQIKAEQRAIADLERQKQDFQAALEQPASPEQKTRQ
jgi:hypothetical protein